MTTAGSGMWFYWCVDCGRCEDLPAAETSHYLLCDTCLVPRHFVMAGAYEAARVALGKATWQEGHQLMMLEQARLGVRRHTRTSSPGERLTNRR